MTAFEYQFQLCIDSIDLSLTAPLATPLGSPLVHTPDRTGLGSVPTGVQLELQQRISSLSEVSSQGQYFEQYRSELKCLHCLRVNKCIYTLLDQTSPNRVIGAVLSIEIDLQLTAVGQFVKLQIGKQVKHKTKASPAN